MAQLGLLGVVVFAFLLGAGANAVHARPSEQGETSANQAASDRPFAMPFAEPSGTGTWLLGQPYGNTTGAYRQRRTTYGAGQGIHFGVDFQARCGTPVVAAADGVVFAADAMSFGAAPHNLMIDHPDLGYSTFYGHLNERPALSSGERVTRGQVVGQVGDPGLTCRSRPHLHFEIRDLRHARKYNPAVLVDADWDTLALVGPGARTWQRDLSEPRKWQFLDDQPEIVVGGPLINDFAQTWPPDAR